MRFKKKVTSWSEKPCVILPQSIEIIYSELKSIEIIYSALKSIEIIYSVLENIEIIYSKVLKPFINYMYLQISSVWDWKKEILLWNMFVI